MIVRLTKTNTYCKFLFNLIRLICVADLVTVTDSSLNCCPHWVTRPWPLSWLKTFVPLSQHKPNIMSLLHTYMYTKSLSAQILTLLCFSPVGTTTPFHGSGSTSVPSMLKGHQQPYSAPHNSLDSTAPRIKRGKEREIPKVKRPTALKKVNDLSWSSSFRRVAEKFI